MEQFISEPIKPQPGTFDAQEMARGEPGLPARFTWRGDEHRVAEVYEKWVTSSPEPGGEVYLRRHWWSILTDRGVRMKLYCERQGKAKGRWYLYTIERA